MSALYQTLTLWCERVLLFCAVVAWHRVVFACADGEREIEQNIIFRIKVVSPTTSQQQRRRRRRRRQKQVLWRRRMVLSPLSTATAELTRRWKFDCCTYNAPMCRITRVRRKTGVYSGHNAHYLCSYKPSRSLRRVKWCGCVCALGGDARGIDVFFQSLRLKHDATLIL